MPKKCVDVALYVYIGSFWESKIIIRSLHSLPKWFKCALKGLRKILASESPLKMMKDAFYFTLKLLAFTKCLNFCLECFVIRKNGLIRRITLISKFMASQAKKKTIAIHITYCPMPQEVKTIKQWNVVG